MAEELEIENRLDRIADIHNKLSVLMKDLPKGIPQDIKQKIIEYVLGDKDLQDLINGIKNRRPPRFILVGRTGAGKSSLINAICGKYMAETSDVTPGTADINKFKYESNGKTVFEVIDTRGIGESLKTESSAEEILKNEILDFSPDIILFLVRAKTRDYIDDDVNYLKEIDKILGHGVPIIALSTQVDELEPSREKDPSCYSARKIRNIQEATSQLANILKENKVEVKNIIPVSSYIEWSVDPSIQTEDNLHEITIAYDGRYNINTLIDVLENNLEIQAGIYLNFVSRLDEVTTKVAKKLTMVFSGISGLIGATPIPFSDIFLLTTLQIILIILIGYLGGRDMNYNTAKDLLIGIGGAGAFGYGLRILVQQGLKFIPGPGDAISGGVASAGTYIVGMASIELLIKGNKKGIEKEKQLSQIIKKAKDEYESEQEAKKS